MVLYLIRHGEPDYKTDSLTEKGKIQASLVAQRLKNAKIDRIFSSTMGRARETAEYTSKLLGKEVTELPWAREIGGKTTFPDGIEKNMSLVPSFATKAPEYIDLGFADSLKCGGFDSPLFKEKFDNMISGALGFLAENGYEEENGVFKTTKDNSEKIALFAHSNMIRTLVAYLLHIPTHIMWAGFEMNYTAITVLNFQYHKNGVCAPRMLTFAESSHLLENDGVNFVNRFYI